MLFALSPLGRIFGLHLGLVYDVLNKKNACIMIKTRENRENYRFTEDTHFYLFGEARAKKIDERMCFDLG